MGYFIAFKIIQQEIKNEVITKINNGVKAKEITKLEISKADQKKIVWSDNGKELLYKDMKYDVIKVSETKTTFIILCIKDKKETELCNNLKKHVDSNIAANKTNKNDASKKLVDSMVKLFFSTQSSYSLFPIQSAPQSKFTQTIYRHPLLQRNFPPPKFV